MIGMLAGVEGYISIHQIRQVLTFLPYMHPYITEIDLSETVNLVS